MLRLFILIFIATLSNHAFANAYFGGGLGWKFERFSHTKYLVPGFSVSAADTRQNDRGEMYHLFIGQNWQTPYNYPFRTELAFFYHEGGYDQTITYPSFQNYVEFSYLTSRTYTALLRILYDLDIGHNFTLYSGIGLGAALVQVDGSKTDNSIAMPKGTFSTRNNFNFSWSLIAGVQHPLAKNTSFAAEYQYLHSGSAQTEKGCSSATTLCAPAEYGSAVSGSHSIIFRLIQTLGKP